MASSTTLYLVRHAEQDPDANEADDPGLSSAGRAQALQVGSRFADVALDAVQHSPQQRAVQTARLLATRLTEAVVQQSDLLRDVTPVPAVRDEDSYPPWLSQRLLHVPTEVRHALDAPAWRWAGLQPANASVTIVQFSDTRPPVLLAFNDVAHVQGF